MARRFSTYPGNLEIGRPRISEGKTVQSTGEDTVAHGKKTPTPTFYPSLVRMPMASFLPFPCPDFHGEKTPSHIPIVAGQLQHQSQAADLGHAEWLALLLDREAANRNTKRFQARLRSANLRHGQAAIEDVDYRTSRRLDKALLQQLTAGKRIAEHRILLVTGPCGIVKSWLSCALAQKACRDGYTVYYARLPRLFADREL